jgi:DegV family protein with EDD domain
MKIGFVTDSTSDLPGAIIEEHELEVIPCILVIDGKEYVDGIDITRDEFYKKLSSMPSSVPITTAAPSIGEFSSRYESLLSRGCDHIISLHAAGALTSIIDSARQAAHDFDGRITIIDSTSLTLGLGFQVLAAVEAAELGMQAALEAIESTRQRLDIYAALSTMENLKRSGRVPGVVAALGSLLSIKPLIRLKESEVKAISAVRTSSQGNEKILDLLLQQGTLERLAILHTGAESRAKEFLNTVMQKASQMVPRDILMVNVTTVIGTHVGPNGLGFAAIRAAK